MAGTMFDNGLKTRVNDVAKTITHNPAIVQLNQTTSGTYTQAEVQAIADKVDEIIQLLRNAGIIIE